MEEYISYPGLELIIRGLLWGAVIGFIIGYTVGSLWR